MKGTDGGSARFASTQQFQDPSTDSRTPQPAASSSPLSFGRIANFAAEPNYYREELLEGPIKFVDSKTARESIGGVTPDFRNLKVEVAVRPQSEAIRVKTLDLPMRIRVTRSYNGRPFSRAEIASIRAHEKKHLDSYKPPMSRIVTSVQQVSRLVRDIRDPTLRMAVARKLAPILETDAQNYLIRRLNIEGLRQSYHLDHFQGRLRDVEKGRIVELPGTYGDAFRESLQKERHRIAREFANQGVQIEASDTAVDVVKKACDRANTYDARYDTAIDAIERAVRNVIAKER